MCNVYAAYVKANANCIRNTCETLTCFAARLRYVFVLFVYMRVNLFFFKILSEEKKPFFLQIAKQDFILDRR